MKKLLCLFILICFFNNLKAQPPITKTHKFTDNAEAETMITYFKHSSKRLKYVGYDSFDPTELAQLCSETGVSSVKFFLASYPSTDPSDKKDVPVVLLQIVKSTESLITSTAYYYGQLCPPPYDGTCSLTFTLTHKKNKPKMKH